MHHLYSILQPNTVCYSFLTPLVRSILARLFECTCLLLKAGADPNLDLDGVTPFRIAAAEGEADIIKCMLKAGANPNITDTDGLTPLEIAAGRGNDAAVMVLLPMTPQIPTVTDWSLVGIMKHVFSEGRRQSGLKRRETFLLSKSRGEEPLKRKGYTDAIYWYSKAIDIAPDATAFCNRSLCWAHLNEGSHALSDAEACIAMRPDWGKARYREGVAWKLLENLPMLVKAFSRGLKVDPENKELKVAFREAVVAEGWNPRV